MYIKVYKVIGPQHGCIPRLLRIETRQTSPSCLLTDPHVVDNRRIFRTDISLIIKKCLGHEM